MLPVINILNAVELFSQVRIVELLLVLQSVYDRLHFPHRLLEVVCAGNGEFPDLGI